MWKNISILNYGKQDSFFKKELVKVIEKKVLDKDVTLTYEHDEEGNFVISIERITFLPDLNFFYIPFAQVHPKLSGEQYEIEE